MRHEEAAAFAAGADAELNGELASSGIVRPGQPALHQRAVRREPGRVPVLAIASHIPSAEIGSSYFKRRTRKSSSANAASTPSWSATRRSCRGCSRSRCAPRSRARRRRGGRAGRRVLRRRAVAPRHAPIMPTRSSVPDASGLGPRHPAGQCEEGDDPRRRGRRGCARRGHRARREAAGADRARPARQGAHRGGRTRTTWA